VSSGIPNVIIHTKFYVDRLRGFWAAGPPKVAFPILIGTTLTTVLHYRADCYVILIWNILSNFVVSTDMVNTFKRHLHQFWFDQDVMYSYKAEANGIGSRSIIVQYLMYQKYVILSIFLGYRGFGWLFPFSACDVMWCDVKICHVV